MSKYPNLSLLFGGYLHQDWSSEHRSPDEAVRHFVECEPAGTVEAAASELGELLVVDSGDELLLATMLGDAGSYYDPASEGRSRRGWLADVHRILQEGSSRRDV